MVRTTKCCEDCARKCLLLHRNRRNSSFPVSSFFKVMFGSRFHEFLSLPSKFSASVSKLTGQETILQNSSSGSKWKVIYSRVEGSVAFGKGWDVFVSDNKLEIGDFVVFNYIAAGSYYIFQMYDKSGCEKLDTSAVSHPPKSAGKQPFLKLPTPLPSFCHDKPGSNKTVKVVHLVDSSNKLWQVLYNGSVPSLMGGWEAFCKANNIQPTDRCTFNIRKDLEDEYEVHVACNVSE